MKLPPFGPVYLWASVPLALAGAVALGLIIAALVRLLRNATLHEVPLQACSRIGFDAAGTVQMHLEGPRFTTTFAGLRYEIVSADNGQAVPIRRRVVGMQSSGVETVRMLHGKLDVPAPGAYELRVTGLEGRQRVERCHIVFTRPYTLPALFCTLGIVASGLMFIGGTVLSLIAASY